MAKRAMVIGCKGMDGSHMVDLLNSKGYEVWGISRQDEPHNIKRYAKQVDEIYNFAGKSDVINPFDNVNELEDIWKIPLTVLEQIKGTKVRFFQASSALSFEPTDCGNYITTSSPINSEYPYGAAKGYAHSLVKEYRKNFGIYAVGGIMLPHESERRKAHFFSQKVCTAAANHLKVELGNLEVWKDFGYAPDYVEAAWLMLQDNEPNDRVLGTGKPTQLREFVKFAYQIEGLNYEDFVTENKEQTRKELTRIGTSNIGFEWKATHNVYATIAIMNKHAKTI